MRKMWIVSLFIFTGFSIGVYFHTNSLELTFHKVKIGKGNSKLRVAHISDLHTKGLGRIELQLLKALQVEKPDVIVLTGDLATPSGTIDGYSSILKSLKAPKGIFFVQGNWEFWEPIADLEKIFTEAGIKDLTNKSFQISEKLWFVGFDDSEEGQPDLKILNEVPADAKTIGLFHSPIFFDQISDLVDLSLSGHSHGGQIRIPIYGSVWVPDGIGRYDQGWFEKGENKLFVSRGIGTSILPIRFNCSPELAIMDIYY